MESPWMKVRTDDGRVYFWNKETQATSWTDPTVPQAIPPPPAAGGPQGSNPLRTMTSDAGSTVGTPVIQVPKRRMCEQCGEGRVQAKVKLTDASGNEREWRLCKKCALSKQSTHLQETAEAKAAAALSRTSTSKIGKYDAKKLKSTNPVLSRHWGLSVKQHGSMGAADRIKLLQQQVEELELAVATEKKSATGLKALLGYYKNDKKQQQLVDGQIADSQQNATAIEQLVKRVASQVAAVENGQDPCNPSDSAHILLMKDGGGGGAGTPRGGGTPRSSHRASDSLRTDDGPAAAPSVIKLAGGKKNKLLDRQWGLRPEHNLLDRSAKADFLYKQLDELEGAVIVEQNGRSGLALLAAQYGSNKEQMKVVQDQANEITETLKALNALLDRVQHDINVVNAKWQRVAGEGGNRDYYWNMDTNEVRWDKPAELASLEMERRCDKCGERSPVAAPSSTRGPDGQEMWLCAACSGGSAPAPAAPAPAVPQPIGDQLAHVQQQADAMQRSIEAAKKEREALDVMTANLPPPPPAAASMPPPGADFLSPRGPASLPPPPQAGAGAAIPPALAAASPAPMSPPPPQQQANIPPPDTSPPPPAAFAAPTAPPPSAPPPPQAATAPPPAAPPPTALPPAALPPAADVPSPRDTPMEIEGDNAPSPRTGGGGGGGGMGELAMAVAARRGRGGGMRGGAGPGRRGGGPGSNRGSPRGSPMLAHRGRGGPGRGGPGRAPGSPALAGRGRGGPGRAPGSPALGRGGRGRGGRGGAGPAGRGRGRGGAAGGAGAGGGGVNIFPSLGAPRGQPGAADAPPANVPDAPAKLTDSPMIARPQQQQQQQQQPPPQEQQLPPPVQMNEAAAPPPGPAADVVNASVAGAPPPPTPVEVPVAVDDDLVQAIANFTAEEDGELSLAKGDLVRVLARDEDGWWKCELVNTPGKIGFLPGNHTRPVVSTLKQ